MTTFPFSTITNGRDARLARLLWRASAITDSDFHAPVIAVANPFNQLARGCVHLKRMSRFVVREIEAARGVAVDPS